MLLVLLVVMTFSLAFFFTSVNTATISLTRQQKTENVLSQAKAALIAWSVLQGDVGTGLNPRPGTLPCPDTTNSGSQGGSCSSLGGTTIGRLPWKTLGIDDLRDADGERLWYALSDNFRRPGSNNTAINSDTPGTLQLYAPDGTTLLTPAGQELAAIIFSVGTPLAGQDRATGPNNSANYLDSANARNNSIANGPFIAGPIRSTDGNILLNDRSVSVSPQELIAAIEKRILNEAQNALAAFALANGGKYPNPAKSNGLNCSAVISNIASPTTCASDSSVCFGRLPEDSLGPFVATWFQQNGWGRIITYAANKNYVLDSSAAECSTALNVDSLPKNYVIVTPGGAKGGQTRPSTALPNYLEDSQNSDAWTSLSSGQATFTAPSASSNDQLKSLP